MLNSILYYMSLEHLLALQSHLVTLGLLVVVDVHAVLVLPLGGLVLHLGRTTLEHLLVNYMKTTTIVNYW